MAKKKTQQSGKKASEATKKKASNTKAVTIILHSGRSKEKNYKRNQSL